MKFLASLFILHGIVLFFPLSACENAVGTFVAHLAPENDLDSEIDTLLNFSEE